MLTENNRCYSHTYMTLTLAQKVKRTHVFIRGGVAVGVLNYQVVQAGRIVSYVHKLAPVIGWQRQQAFYYLNTKQISGWCSEDLPYWP